MTGLALEDDTITDFTSQISDKLRSPIATGSFGEVYRCTIESSLQGPVEVAVKVFKIDTGKDMDKNQKGIRRELNVWLRLKRPTIVPLLGIAYIDPPFPALVSQWMSSGTLYTYLEQQATITTSARVGLCKGIADGLHYLHSKNVVHGDLHPANILIDGLGNPCLTDFGLATVVEDPELQWSTITLGLNFDSRWRAPEVLGIENDPQRPTFMSDIYSFGGVVFFIVSGNVPWKEKKYQGQIFVELSKRATPARSHHIFDNHWDLIQNCWSWDPRNRPGAWEILNEISGGGRPRNVVVYGEAGAGKSSLINLIMGNDVAMTSPDRIGRTYRHTSCDVTIGEQCFRLWDTPGLNHACDVVPADMTRKNLTAFLRGLDQADGVHLLIYCICGTRAVGAQLANYKIFSSVIGGSKVPIVIIVTCLEDFRPEMEEWWNRNNHRLSELGMQFSGHACVTTLEDDPMGLTGISKRRAQSYQAVCGLILDKCSQPPHKKWGRTRNFAPYSSVEMVEHNCIFSPTDLTGQIFGTINDYVAAGAFGNVYRCEWRRPTGSVKVAVKVIKLHTSEEDLRRLRQEAGIWARLMHENIVSLLGTTKGFGPSPALVSLWFPHGTLLRLIADEGARLSIKSKLNLLHDIASGLHYLHSFPIVHGDIISSNVLIDIKEGRYKACLTDFGLSTVLGGLLDDHTIEGSIVRHGAIRWTAPELLRLAHDHPADSNVKPTKENDIYSFGRVMFHVLTLLIPWGGIDDYQVLHKILCGEEIRRPETPHDTPDITDVRWNEIELCWSIDAPARPSALMVMGFLKSELEALTDDDVLVGEAQESRQSTSFTDVEAIQVTASDLPECSSPTEVGSNPTVNCGEQLQAGTTIVPPPRSASRTLDQRPSQQDSPDSPITLHSSATASSLSLSRHLNVLIFGETGVGKSSVINLIMGLEVAQMSPDAPTCMLEHTFYEVSLGNQRFKLWEVSSIASMGLFQRLIMKQRLERTYRKLYRDDGVYLLLYCMRNSRPQGSWVRDYEIFTSIVSSTSGHVPVAAVVTCLEDYPMDMDEWWKKNEKNLEHQGIQFSKHACITSLPDDPYASLALCARRRRSEQTIRSLICESYQAGRSAYPFPIL